MGRNAAGVRGIRLREGDRVISSTILDNDSGYILTITENGYGKITEVNEYRKQSRDGLGIKNISELEKTGPIVGVSYVTGNEEMVVFTRMVRVSSSRFQTYPQEGESHKASR